MLQVSTQKPAPGPRRGPPSELRGLRAAPAPHVAVQAAVAGAGPGPGPGGGAGPAPGRRQRRQPADPPGRLRQAVRGAPLLRTPVEGDGGGPDPGGERGGGRVWRPDPHGEGAAGGGRGLHPAGEAPAGPGPGPGGGHRRREDRVLAQSPHEVLEETPVPAQEDRGAAADGAEDQQHPAQPRPQLRRRRDYYQYVNKLLMCK